MLEVKLRPHPARDGLIERDRILARLSEDPALPVIAVVAPPGYGKTTVLGQFQASLQRPSAWLTLDNTDNDPVLLLGGVADAMAAAGMLIDEGRDRRNLIGAGEVLTVGVNTLAEALDPASGGVLFLDQVDHLDARSALDVVGALMTRLSGTQVVVASRSRGGLPLALLRSRGSLVEITAEDLAMDEVEARSLFNSIGVDPGEDLTSIVERTEGWPAGLYLTALAVKSGAPWRAESGVRGDDFFLADYLREELLDTIESSTLSFLTRSSILTRLSGSLCDFVLERNDSARTLDELEQANLLVVPMDRTREWYRYHSLLQDYLRVELGRTDPGLVTALHSRAATWFEVHGYTDLAIDHAAIAGELDRLAEMITGSARKVYAEGRMETISGWLQALEEGGALVDHPELAALGSFALSLDGDVARAERFAVAGLTDAMGHPKEDGTLGPFALLLRSVQALKGPERAREDARQARTAFGHLTEWIPGCLAAEAYATIAIAGTEAAEPLWTDGLWRSESLQAHPFTTLGLAHRALAAMGRGDWDSAGPLIEKALRLIEEGGLELYITSGLPFTVAARLAARAGDIPSARAYLSTAARTRPRLTPAIPLLSVHVLNEMARAFIEVADIAGARRVSRDAADIVAIRPKLGLIASEHQTIKERLAEMPAGSVGASSLTTAELRLLPLLVTHLSYPEIADRLFVSRHTVKTQAMSIYRKLGVSSRTGAVEKAREVGLINL